MSDLALLGAGLERATDRHIRRRRMRQQAVRGTVVSLLLAVSVVLGGAVGRLAPAGGPLPDVPRIVATAFEPPTIAFMVRHIRDEPADPSQRIACYDARSCGRLVVPVENLTPRRKS
jgi:hypothetical protein